MFALRWAIVARSSVVLNQRRPHSKLKTPDFHLGDQASLRLSSARLRAVDRAGAGSRKTVEGGQP
jgi:hypothetical protein